MTSRRGDGSGIVEPSARRGTGAGRRALHAIAEQLEDPDADGFLYPARPLGNVSA